MVVFSVKEVSILGSDLLEAPIENPGLTLFVDILYLKTEGGGYRVGHTITNLSFLLEYSRLRESQPGC